MYDFTYHRPGTLADATDFMQDNEDAVLMSGGMTLVPTMKQRLAMPSDVVDLSGVSDASIAVEDGRLCIGAGATHADVADSQTVADAIPALAALAGDIGDPHVRHRGTLGGSIANNDPAADYPAAVLALGATIVTSSRSLPADAFFTGMFETALEHGEIVTAVRFPIPARAGYCKFPNPASRYAVVGVFVADFGDKIQGGGHRCRPGGVPACGNGGSTEGRVFARRVGRGRDRCRWPQRGYPRLSRLSGASCESHGKAGGRKSYELGWACSFPTFEGQDQRLCLLPNDVYKFRIHEMVLVGYIEHMD